MRETSKATKRRLAEDITDTPGPPGFWSNCFKGVGIDVGAATDALSWPYNSHAVPFDLPDGGGDDISRFFPGAQFNFVHGSNVLEHANDPGVMLLSWLNVLKPGGYVVATVPDFWLYEHGQWPSKTNAGHRTAWYMHDQRNYKPALGRCGRPPEGVNIPLPSWLWTFRGVEVLLCRIVDTNYNYSLGPEIDQTFDESKGVEAFIEFVLRKI